MDDKIYFDTITDKCDNYFVVYSPPIPGWKFSTLSINYISNVTTKQVVEDLVNLSEIWTNKFPISLMANSFDQKGDLIDLSGFKSENYLTTIVIGNTKKKRWGTVSNNEFPEISKERLFSIFIGLDFKKQSDIDKTSLIRAKSVRRFRSIIIFWTIILPLIITMLEYFSPEWIGILGITYSFWKAYKQWRIETGRDEKPKIDQLKEDDNRTMEHHHYHCKLNPEAFLKLKVENLQSMQISEIQEKHKEIKNTS